MTAYYNESNKHAAGWLRNLAADGLIPPGHVDDRDIRDVTAADLVGFTQCHFFAGIGLWPYALRLAGWDDEWPVWTGSCPCQPFSAAGKGEGFADERHLWPAWFWLIEQHRPGVVFGEQVASTDGLMWLDLVSSDLEACDYACGPLNFPSCGIGAPNIRQRSWWVADTESGRRGINRLLSEASGRRQDTRQPTFGDKAAAGGMADTNRDGRPIERDQRRELREDADRCGADGRMGFAEGVRPPTGPSFSDAGYGPDQSERSGDASWLGHASRTGLSHAEPQTLEGPWWRNERRATQQPSGPFDPWREFEWLACADGKFRPTQPGLFPLAPRYPGDVAKLRAYGNAINPEVAAEVIRAYLDCRRS